MQYVLLIYPGNSWATLDDLSDAERMSIIGEYGEINEAPDVTPGLPLGLPQDATTVAVLDGKTVMSPGPYVGVDGTIAGWYLFEADDLKTAIELASRVPAARRGGAVEIRPVATYW